MASSTGSGEEDYGIETYPSVLFSDRVVSDDYLPGLRTVPVVPPNDWQLRYERACVTINHLRDICREARQAAWEAKQKLDDIRDVLDREGPRQ